MGRILGLDVGDKTIGIALSDELHWTAQGVMTLKREGRKKDIPALVQFVMTHDVEEIVLGFPKNMNDTIGERAEKVLKFSRRLEAQLPNIKICLCNYLPKCKSTYSTKTINRNFNHYIFLL